MVIKVLVGSLVLRMVVLWAIENGVSEVRKHEKKNKLKEDEGGELKALIP